jgi:hypothetical protein
MMIWNPSYRTPLLFMLMGVLFCLLVPSVHAQELQENRAFVEQQYRDFLGREGDAGGIDFWTGELEAGRTTRAQVADDFFRSAEFQNNIAPVARLYFAYFGRIPDYPGLMYWVGEFQAGGNLNAMSQAFADSAEFGSRYGALNDGAFVDLVYQNVLGRLPDAGGRAFWVSQLAAGMSRGAMMIGFSESEEYRQRSFRQVQVTMMYVSMLRRAPDQGGFDYWVSALSAGDSVLGLIAGFLTSFEYSDRFLNRHTVSATANLGGSIFPPSQTVSHGGTATFTVTPDSGYRITSVSGCGGNLDGNTYTTGAITAGCEVEISFTFGTNPLNDTGIDWCADGANNYEPGSAPYKATQCQAVTFAGFSRQDGHFGSDPAARDGTLLKIGAGDAGFDFTKLDASGQDLPHDADAWSCVRDNVTGLVWEVKVNDPNHLRHFEHTYTVLPLPHLGGNVYSGSCVGSDCNTDPFVEAVNAQGLCGARDWRMPTLQELIGITHFGKLAPPMDTNYFPYALAGGRWDMFTFWSGSRSADDIERAWVFHVLSTVSYQSQPRSQAVRVRLVSDGNR